MLFSGPTLDALAALLRIALHSTVLGLWLALGGAALFGRRPTRPVDVWRWILGLLLMAGFVTWAAAWPTRDLFSRGPLLLGVIAGTLGVGLTLDRRTASGCLWRTAAVCVSGAAVVLFLPALEQPREAARRTQCRHNLKQIGLALHNYHELYDVLPSAAGSPAGAPVSWRVGLVHFLEPRPPTPAYRTDLPWHDPANLLWGRTPPFAFTCPSRDSRKTDAQGRVYTSYALVTGPGSIAPAPERSLSWDEISDGLSHTAVVVEACGRDIVWTEPRDVDVTDPVGVNLPGATPGTSPGILSSRHQGAAMVLRADGSVRMVSDAVAPSVLRGMLSASGHDPSLD